MTGAITDHCLLAASLAGCRKSSAIWTYDCTATGSAPTQGQHGVDRVLKQRPVTVACPVQLVQVCSASHWQVTEVQALVLPA
jgi:hypothetical protein